MIKVCTSEAETTKLGHAPPSSQLCAAELRRASAPSHEPSRLADGDDAREARADETQEDSALPWLCPCTAAAVPSTPSCDEMRWRSSLTFCMERSRLLSLRWGQREMP